MQKAICKKCKFLFLINLEISGLRVCVRNRVGLTEMSLGNARAWGACGRQFEFVDAIKPS